MSVRNGGGAEIIDLTTNFPAWPGRSRAGLLLLSSATGAASRRNADVLAGRSLAAILPCPGRYAQHRGLLAFYFFPLASALSAIAIGENRKCNDGSSARGAPATRVAAPPANFPDWPLPPTTKPGSNPAWWLFLLSGRGRFHPVSADLMTSKCSGMEVRAAPAITAMERNGEAANRRVRPGRGRNSVGT